MRFLPSTESGLSMRALLGDALPEMRAQTLSPSSFSFLEKSRPSWRTPRIAAFVLTRKWRPRSNPYGETMGRASKSMFFFTTQRKEIPLIRRSIRC